MRKPGYAVIVVLVALLSFLAGGYFSSKSQPGKVASSRQVLHYICPMHPGYKSDKPGAAPCCGMELEAVYADGQSATAANPSMPAGTVRVTPEKQQIIGVRLGVVERAASQQTIRTTGRVLVQENRIYKMIFPLDCLVRESYPVNTGDIVRKDQLVAKLYSREIYSAQTAYFNSLGHLDDAQNEPDQSSAQLAMLRASVRQSEESLRSWGMSDIQIQEIAKKRRHAQTVDLRAPITGLVLVRNISQESRLPGGTEMYRIADISRLWVLADLYENEVQYIRPGLLAKVRIPHYGKTVSGKVTDVLPQFDVNSRTMKVRLEIENPNILLRPDMFVDVEFPVKLPPSLTVPAEAVLDTGLKRTVFVDRGNGYFEPRRVETGWRFGDRVQIVKGLMEGESIVISGTFLVDSESKLKSAAAGIFGDSAKDPVCDMDVDEAKAKAAGRTHQHGGKTYFFCSDQCRRDFANSPAKYLSPGHQEVLPVQKVKASPGAAAGATAKDPVCGMDVEVAAAQASGKMSVFAGASYYFCAEQCKREFDMAPSHYLQQTPPQPMAPTDKAVQPAAPGPKHSPAEHNPSSPTGGSHD